MLKYKLNEEIRYSKYNQINENALICELGFYIGTNKEIDEYIKKNIVFGIVHNTDEYIIFYLFCKFVVEKFFDSEVKDIYELIDYNYMRLVGMFLNEKCSIVENSLQDNKYSYDEIKKFITDYFDYTTTISITESEWLGKYEWLENWICNADDETMKKLYHKECLKDLLYDLIYNQDDIEKQIITDLQCYEIDDNTKFDENKPAEFDYMVKFYNKWKYLFNFKISALEIE